MKIQIDTDAKTIKVENDILLIDFFEKIKNLLPNGLWKEFKLIGGKTVYWHYPNIVYTYQYQYKQNDHYKPWINYGTAGEAINCNSGVYNVEIN